MVSDRTLSRVLPRGPVALYGDLIRVATAIAVVVTIIFLGIYYRFQGDHLNDFRVFYYSTQAWLNGQDMYGPTAATTVPVGGGQYRDLWNMNPPHFHLLVLPFALLPLGSAMAGWVLVNVGMLVWSLGAVARAVGARWTASGALWTVFAAMVFSATCALVATGQLTWMLMVPVTLSWMAARRGLWPRAALLLGVTTSIKPFLGIFLVYFVLRRMWRETALMLTAGLACGAVGVAIFGWQLQWRWFETLGAVDWPWAAMNASLTGFLTRLLSENPFVPHLAKAPHLIGPLALGGGLLVVVVTFRRLLREPIGTISVDRTFAALLMAALLVSPLGWVYYLWLGAGPLLSLLWFRSHSLHATTCLFLALAAPGLVWPVHALSWFGEVAWAGPTVGGIYFWAVLGLWSAALSGEDPAPQ